MPSSDVRAGRRVRYGMAGAAVAALLAPLPVAGPATAPPEPRALQGAFARAAAEHRVPVSVLLGVSYLQSRWDGHQGAASVSAGYGPMHLTDARTALRTAGGERHAETEDARGDTSRPLRVREAPRGAGKVPARLRTLEKAARLTGLPRAELRERAAANIEGGAALLAAGQRKLGLPLSEDPVDWYGAVAAYPHADGEAAAGAFADDVFAVLREGKRRTTDAGERVSLPGAPGLRPRRAQLSELSLRAAAPGGRAECPSGVTCEWLPAPHERYKNKKGEADYGNHDRAGRPRSPGIDYIVVHDVEGYWGSATRLVRDREYVSWHYTLRSSDGHIAQHVPEVPRDPRKAALPPDPVRPPDRLREGGRRTGAHAALTLRTGPCGTDPCRTGPCRSGPCSGYCWNSSAGSGFSSAYRSLVIGRSQLAIVTSTPSLRSNCTQEMRSSEHVTRRTISRLSSCITGSSSTPVTSTGSSFSSAASSCATSKGTSPSPTSRAGASSGRLPMIIAGPRPPKRS